MIRTATTWNRCRALWWPCLCCLGKKHQAKLREKVAVENPSPETPDPPIDINLSRRMVDLAKSVVGSVTAADVGPQDSGIYCKVCRTIVCGGKDDLQSHLRGKHLTLPKLPSTTVPCKASRILPSMTCSPVGSSSFRVFYYWFSSGYDMPFPVQPVWHL